MTKTKTSPNQVLLVASGDLRLSATAYAGPLKRRWRKPSATHWPPKAMSSCGPILTTRRKARFLSSQRQGIDVFRTVDPDAKLIVAEAVWQYSHHVLPGLTTHSGTDFDRRQLERTMAGLVGMLNLNGSLTKAGIPYSTLWSEDFSDDFFKKHLRRWLKTGKIKHALDHVHPLAR